MDGYSVVVAVIVGSVLVAVDIIVVAVVGSSVVSKIIDVVEPTCEP